MDENLKKTNQEPNPNNDNLETAPEVGSEATTQPTTEQTSTQAVSDTATDTTESPSSPEQQPVEQSPESQGSEVAAVESESNMTVFIVGAIILGLAMVAAAWFFMSNNDSAINGATVDGMQLEMDGDPDDPVAIINGQTITRAEFNRIRQQVVQSVQQQGMDINDPQVQSQINAQATETLINTELIRQAAAAAGASATDAEVDARYAEIVEAVGGVEALQASLAQLGLTEESLRSDVEQELVIEQYLEENLDRDSLAVSDQEVNELYEMSGGAEAGLPPVEDVRPQIEQQILANKEQELIGELLEQLRAEAEIELLI